MNGLAKQAAFYRGYLADKRSLVPLTILFAAAVPLWLLVYLVGAAANSNQDRGAAYAASERLMRDPSGRAPAGPARCAFSTQCDSALRGPKTRDATCRALTSG
jgi:hypothetical protein